MLNKLYCFVILLGTFFIYQCSQPSNAPDPEFDLPLSTYNLTTQQTKTLSDPNEGRYDQTTLFFGEEDSTIFIFDNRLILVTPVDLSNIDPLYTITANLDQPFDVSISPNKHFFVFSAREQNTSNQPDIYMVDIQKLELMRITDSPNTYYRYPRFSLDNRRLIFSGERKDINLNTIEIYDLITMTTDTIRIDQSANSQSPQFRFPHFLSNEKILYVSRGFGAFVDSIITISPSGNDKQILETACCFVTPLVVSQNGERVVYTTEGNPEKLISIRSDGSEYYELINGFDFGELERFSVSSDGNTILYWLEENRNLYYVNSDGTNRRSIANARNGVFSSDLSIIAFASIREK